MSCNKTDNPLISIIVPVYNVEKYLNRCLDSIVSQTYKNLEIILVDDGSTDNSGNICDKYALEYDRIRVIHQKNSGQSKARNVALDLVEGEYVAFVDSDDFVHENYISYMLEIMQTKKCDIVQIGFVTGNAANFPDLNMSKIKISVLDKYEVLSGFGYKVVPWGKLYKKQVIGEIRFPVGMINEDEATYYKFAYYSKKICISERKLYYYFQSTNSTMRNDRKPKFDFIKVYDERVNFFSDKEKVLLQRTYERYAIVLILNYSGLLKKNIEKSELKIILDKFKEIYHNCIFASRIKYRPLLLLFFLLPDFTAKIIGMLRN